MGALSAHQACKQAVDTAYNHLVAAGLRWVTQRNTDRYNHRLVLRQVRTVGDVGDVLQRVVL